MNEPEVPKQPAASPDPLGSTPTPPPDTEPFIGTLHRMWARLKAHKVVQWTLAYLAIAYTLLHGAEMLAGTLNWSHGLLRIFTLILILGIPVVTTLAWYHGARGQQRVSGTEVMIIALLLAVGGAFLWRDSKDNEQNTETATEAKRALATALSVTPVAPDDKSIAVLPFADMSADKNQGHMADGIAEELLNQLAQVPELKVIARTSSFAFKGQNIEIAEIARRLNVAHVLEGSVRQSGNTLRITAQLVRAADSTHLWSHKYDRPLQDIFAVQDEIANAIVRALQTSLIGDSLNRRDGGTQNLDAYALALQAREIAFQFTPVALEQSIVLYRQALTLDPAYAEAWVGLATIYCHQVNESLRDPDDGIQLARAATEKALELDPQNALAHARLGWIAIYYSRDYESAARHLMHALTLEPTNIDTINTSAILLRRLGRLDQSIELSKYLVAHDPVNPEAHDALALAYEYSKNWASALKSYGTQLLLSPQYSGAYANRGTVLLLMGDAEAAHKEVQRESDDRFRLYAQSLTYHALGQSDASDAAFGEFTGKYGHGLASYAAASAAYRGDTERAFEWLEKAAQNRDPSLGAIPFDPLCESLHKDPRWPRFLRKYRMAPDQLAAIKFELKVPQH